MPLLIYSGETTNSKMEKSYENLNQQMIMKLSDEALELGITAIPPKRLNSSSNILINNHSINGSRKKPLTATYNISDTFLQVCNKHYSNKLLKNYEDGKIKFTP